MSWMERLSAQGKHDKTAGSNASMRPGLTGHYNPELREKAGMHIPPPPPECMGLEGEYDPCGLVKRAAIALDHDDITANVETLKMTQNGREIIFQGRVPDQLTLNRIVKLTSEVDGTDSVNTNGVLVESDHR